MPGAAPVIILLGLSREEVIILYRDYIPLFPSGSYNSMLLTRGMKNITDDKN